jgi:GT2 family glycosyltransferase
VAKYRASIVVLCYNGLEVATRACLESIVANTPADSYELIVVDNASTDGTSDYLAAFAAQHANVRLQLNSTNKGYAAGNNDGIKLAKGQYVILLNNDTLVPNGWLDRLLSLFNGHPDIGLVGPVTNSAGNEQRIELEGLNEKNFEEIAGAYANRQRGVWFTTDKLGFFCVAMRRTLYENIGLLDEAFGIGMFEDDDYCVRVKKAGFSLVVVEDCFVYHKGSVSFKKLTASDYIEIFKRNRHYFFEKHGIIWTYADIANGIWDKIRDDIVYIKKNVENAAVERITGRVNDMTNALSHLRYIEQKNAQIDDNVFIEVQLAEKHRKLMEISDWATTLKQDNERMAEAASTARTELMAMSDWATSLKCEIEEMSRSRCYRLFRFLQRRGI